MDMMDVWSIAFRFSDCIFEIKIKAYLLTSLLIFCHDFWLGVIVIRLYACQLAHPYWSR